MIDQPQSFDAIVIGSGIGGLTTAALLSKLYHQKVLVLEQHFTVGGFTHSFERKGKFHWDVGLHYVGDMGQGSTGRAVFDYITNGSLKWHPMPDPFEKFVYPDFTFEVPTTLSQYQAALIQQFPHEQAPIQTYFKDVQRAAFWFGAYSMLELFPQGLEQGLRPLIGFWGQIARQTTQTYLDKHFQDHQLKALLTSQWGDYGLPPAQSCFGIHALIVTHFAQGGWYPVGGSQAIAQAIVPVIEQEGGRVLTQQRVTELLIESGVAKGVKTERTARQASDTQRFYAPVVISDAGAFNTYLKLIPADYPLEIREAIKAFPKGTSMMTVYLGLKADPRHLGFNGENHWIYTTYDHNAIASDPPLPAEGLPKFGYLSFPSLKDPLAKSHTAEIIAHVDFSYFQQWQEQSWRRRDHDYAALKETITQSLIKLVEHHYPGFQDIIEFAELSTPLTVEHFNSSHQGAIYGIPCIPERLDQPWIGSRTPVKNLYLTGADAFSLGIMGAMMGGVKTAGLIQGPLGFFKIMAAVHHKPSQYPQEG